MIKKTDMLTPAQFNKEKTGTPRFFCSNLAFAIGAPTEDFQLKLDYESNTELKEQFRKKLSEYGLNIRKVDSLKKLDGKTGFILYGYYPRGTNFGHKWDAYHVVRVNPDKTCVHFDRDALEQYVEPNEKGEIPGYCLIDGPIQFFKLIEERQIDKDKLNKRMCSVFNEIDNILKKSNVGDDAKNKLRAELQLIKDKLVNHGGHLTSNYANIILENALKKAKEYDRAINSEELVQQI